MKNILVNGFKSNQGGGANIFLNFYNQASNYSKHNYHFFILISESVETKFKVSENVTLIKIPNIYNTYFFSIYFYLFYFRKIIKKYSINSILNFGDIIIPYKKINQIYFFDWAYAVYLEKYIWRNMSIKDLFVRVSKIILIKFFIKYNNIIICQSETIKNRLKKIYNVNNILVIQTPLNECFKSKEVLNKTKFKFPKNKKLIFYPASYSTHKNHNILIKLDSLITTLKIPLIIITTVDDSKRNIFTDYLINSNNSNIFNLGTLDISDIYNVYEQVDALFFPSYLESYGFPLYESMFFGLPIIASKMDFVEDACMGNYIGFNPFDVESILISLEKFCKIEHPTNIDYSKQLENIPSWNKFFIQIKHLL